MCEKTLERGINMLVADVRHEKQEGKAVAFDAGEKIGGAVKDRVCTRTSKKALETVSHFETYTIEYFYEKGVDYFAARAMELLIKRIDKVETTSEYVTSVKELFDGIQTFEDFTSAFKKILRLPDNKVRFKSVASFNNSINKYRSYEAHFEAISKRGLKEWERQLPEVPVVDSPNFILPYDNPIEFASEHQLRAIEFGNSLSDEQGLFHLNNCAQAFADLALLLQVDKKQLALGGTLAMAFASRGKGNALAHYERKYKVINLTKKRGALGVLAHEWFHSLDHYLGHVFGLDNTRLFSEHSIDELSMANVPQGIIRSFGNLLNAVRKGTYTELVRVNRPNPRITNQYNVLASHLGWGDSFEDVVNYYDGILVAKWKKLVRDGLSENRATFQLRRMKQVYADNLVGAYQEQTGQIVKGVDFTSMGNSKYYQKAIDLDRGKEGKYYSTNPELLARCFEFTIHQKLEWRNDYLVAGVDTVAYPFDKSEQEKITDAMWNFLEEILPHI